MEGEVVSDLRVLERWAEEPHDGRSEPVHVDAAVVSQNGRGKEECGFAGTVDTPGLSRSWELKRHCC